MNTIILIIIVYTALISVIWLHEVGHALMYTKYGCKKNPFHVSVRPYIFFSTPLPVDLEKEKKLSYQSKFYVGIAGITINLIIGLPLYLLIIKSQLFSINGYLSHFIYFFVLFHFVEAMTYMVLNNIVVVSDIKSIQDYKPILRIPVFIIGLILVGLITDLYNMYPSEYRYVVGIIILIMCSAMGGARIIFQSILNKGKESSKI